MFVYNKKLLLDLDKYNLKGDNMGWISAKALASRNDTDVKEIKTICRHKGVKINKSVPGVYMIDEDDYDKKLSGGSEVAKKRHLPKKQQQAMQAAKAKKNS